MDLTFIQSLIDVVKDNPVAAGILILLFIVNTFIPNEKWIAWGTKHAQSSEHWKYFGLVVNPFVQMLGGFVSYLNAFVSECKRWRDEPK